MKKITDITVNSHDTDGSGTVRLSCTVRYMQECAMLQLQHTHPTSEELRQRRQAFIISKMSVKCFAPLFAYDDLEVQTWLAAFHGVTYDRVYRIKRNGVTVAEAASIWCLIGSGKKLLRADTWDNTPHTDDDSVDVAISHRSFFPSDDTLEQVGEKLVSYGDIDSNRHFNNTHYPDMYCSFIPELNDFSLGKKFFISDYSVKFLNEAPLGERLTVYRSKTDDVYYFKTVRADGLINTEARLCIAEY